MEKAKKYCPICSFETNDMEMNFCPECNYQNGNGEVRLTFGKPASVSGRPTKVVELPHPIYDESEGVAEQIVEKLSGADGPIIGDANAVNGPVTITQGNKNYDIKVETKELSDAERLRKNEAYYHNLCVQFVKDGFISQDDLLKLSAYKTTLGLHDSIANKILQEVIEIKKRKSTNVSKTDKTYIEPAREAIQRNDCNAIKTSLSEIESYRKEVDTEEIEQIYYQLKAILTPETFIKDFNKVHEQSYWELFWSYIAMIKANYGNADESLGMLRKWETHYPSDNSVLAKTVGYMMRNREQEARTTFKLIDPGYSVELQPLYFAMSELLDQDWEYESTVISPRARFYVDALFRELYNELFRLGKEARDKMLKEAQENFLKEQEILHKQEEFQLQYEKRNGNIGEALEMSGVSQSQFNDWMRSDADFNMAIEAIDKRLAAARDETERIAEEEKKRAEDEAMRQAEEAMRMDEFKICYERNDCDLQKTCADLNESRDTILKWRDANKAFDDSLRYLERESEKRKRELACVRRRAILKKWLPYILAGILIILIGIGISMRIHYNEKEREKAQIENQKQIAIRSDYADKVNLFNENFSKIKRTEDGINEAKSALNILLEIKQIEIEKDTYLEKKYSIELTDELKRKCDELKDHFNGMRFSDDVFVKRDGQHLYNEIDNIRRVL